MLSLRRNWQPTGTDRPDSPTLRRSLTGSARIRQADAREGQSPARRPANQQNLTDFGGALESAPNGARTRGLSVDASVIAVGTKRIAIPSLGHGADPSGARAGGAPGRTRSKQPPPAPACLGVRRGRPGRGSRNHGCRVLGSSSSSSLARRRGVSPRPQPPRGNLRGQMPPRLPPEAQEPAAQKLTLLAKPHTGNRRAVAMSAGT